jgi:hypothetical protein
MTAVASARSRRVALALLAAGLVCLGAAATTWRAPSARAVELFSFELDGQASGVKFERTDSSDAVDYTMPRASSSLQNGPVGYGLASLAWPGPLVSNAGTLVLVLQPSAPPQTSEANYPVRAEARSGQDPPESTNDSVPGTSLRASATAEEVQAHASVQNAAGEGVGFGPSSAHSVSRIGEEGGKVESNSLVEDIDIGGVIKIKSVASTAMALTDGEKADGEATTVVTGMTVAGQPATVDENGFRLGEQGQPLNAIANQIAKQALAEGGFDIFVSTPSKEVEGATAVVDSGALLITQTDDSGQTILKVGGATASVTGAPGFDMDFDVGDVGGDFDSGGFDGGGFGPGPAADFDTGASSDFGTDLGPVDAPAVDGTGSDTGAAEMALPTQRTVATGDPIRPGAVLFALFGAGLFALGMRRLSDTVLAEQVAVAACPLEGEG